MTNGRIDRSVSMLKANIIGIAAVVPVTILFWWLYAAVWGWEHMSGQMAGIYNEGYIPLAGILASLLILVLGTVIHELLHVLAWKVFSHKEWSAFQFGIDKKTLSPYAHCKESMFIGPYRWGGATPGLVTGVIPYLIGLASGNVVWVFWGYLFFLAAVGDWLVLWLLRKEKPGTLVEDHPTRAGCFVLVDAP